MNFHRVFSRRFLPLFLMAGAVLALGASAWADRDDDDDDDEKVVELAESRIFIEYNSSDNDLGFHVKLDGENWRKIKIVNPKRRTIFEVAGKASFGKIGLTELFFEGAEPSLDDRPLAELLALFPEGDYKFSGETVKGDDLVGTGKLTHAVPAAPTNVEATLGANNSLVISWDPVTTRPLGFPPGPIDIIGYQVILDSFQVTLPADATSVTVPAEFVESLEPGVYGFEVLAIEEGGNQTITSGEITLE